MGTWKHKRNDTTPPLEVQVLDSSGVAVNLTGATVSIIIRSVSESDVKVNAAMSFDTDGSDGRLVYEWAVGDTDEAGAYYVEYQVIYASGKKQTFPTVGWDRILIYGDLDDA